MADRVGARAVAVCAVLAIHLALLWPLIDAPTRRAAHAPSDTAPARIALRLIAATPDAAPRRAVAERPARPMPPQPIRPIERPGSPGTAPPGPATAAAPAQEAVTAEAPVASAASPAPSLLDTEATRRAIRASARAPSLGDQLARAREAPDRIGAQERLAEGVKSAGRGDCLKGEFAGAGMGLLSLPFLALAEARGDCAK